MATSRGCAGRMLQATQMGCCQDVRLARSGIEGRAKKGVLRLSQPQSCARLQHLHLVFPSTDSLAGCDFAASTDSHVPSRH